jgi:hypothetical protein
VAAQEHANIEDAVPDNLAMTLKQRLLQQWALFKAHCRPQPRPPGHATDLREFGESDRYECDPLTRMVLYDTGGIPVPKLPAWYWIRTRLFWRDLFELMLYWLTAPVSTAGFERGFSFQTLIDQDTRRRATTYCHMRDDMMVHIHREWFSSRLESTLKKQFYCGDVIEFTSSLVVVERTELARFVTEVS